jgi:hypothetical protein
MKLMAKKNLFWGIFFVLVVLVSGAIVGYVLSGNDGLWPERAPEYSAVYLATGDIYFGELGWFPKPHLKNVWYLQQGVDEENQAQVGILPFKDVAWGPMDKVYLSSDQIVWIARVRDDSQLIQAFAESRALPTEQ